MCVKLVTFYNEQLANDEIEKDEKDGDDDDEKEEKKKMQNTEYVRFKYTCCRRLLSSGPTNQNETQNSKFKY